MGLDTHDSEPCAGAPRAHYVLALAREDAEAQRVIVAEKVFRRERVLFLCEQGAKRLEADGTGGVWVLGLLGRGGSFERGDKVWTRAAAGGLAVTENPGRGDSPLFCLGEELFVQAFVD